MKTQQQAFQKLRLDPQELYETIERPALRPLPAQRYEFAEWKKARVNIDYHIEVDRHYYSVPYQLVRQRSMSALPLPLLKSFSKTAGSPATSEV